MTNSHRVFTALQEAGKPLSQLEIAHRAGISAASARSACGHLASLGKLRNIFAGQRGQGAVTAWVIEPGAVVEREMRGSGRSRDNLRLGPAARTA